MNEAKSSFSFLEIKNTRIMDTLNGLKWPIGLPLVSFERDTNASTNYFDPFSSVLIVCSEPFRNIDVMKIEFNQWICWTL